MVTDKAQTNLAKALSFLLDKPIKDVEKALETLSQAELARIESNSHVRALFAIQAQVPNSNPIRLAFPEKKISVKKASPKKAA